MSPIRVAALWSVAVAFQLCSLNAAGQGSIDFMANDATSYDHLKLTDLPPQFGTGEFTLELWIRPDNSFPVGSTSGGSNQRLNWSNDNTTRYSNPGWWFSGNFLLDGHKNGDQNGGFESGTFSLQFFNGGRLRWTFGDGSAAASNVGQLWGIQNPNSASLLDGQWHQVTLVRRWSGSSSADLEMWIDGVLVDSQTTSARTNMQSAYWSNWTGFPSSQEGWFWGAEKQAANDPFTQYEDYKGLLDEVRFWSRAKTGSEIASGYADPVTGSESGLVGLFRFDEGSGSMSCDELNASRCMSVINPQSGTWSSQNAPTTSSGDTQPPTVPTGLQASAVSSSRIDLSWNASSDNVGVTGYDIRRDGQLVTTVVGTSYSDTGLSPNTNYVYTVAARDAAGNVSNNSSPANATTQAAADTQPPSVPTGLQASAVSSSRIDLSWNASSDNVGVTGYDIRRDGQLVTTVVGTSYSDTGLSPNTNYVYTVAARDAAGNVSNNSSPANATTQAAPDTQPPTVPTGLQASAVSSSRIDLSWNASSDNVGVTGYDIRRDGQLVTTVVGTSYSDTGLSPNTNYVYTVAARDAAGNVSNNSSPANATTQAAADTQPPSVPTGLQASAVSSSRIDLSWNASSDNVGVTGYDIRRDGQLVTTVVGTSYSDTGLSPNTNYVYTVAARDAAGNVSNNSSPANATTQAAPDTQPPTVPTGLQASAVSSSRIDLSWNASSDNVGVTGYDIRRDGQLVTTVVGTSYSDTGLSPNTNYVYTVAARDAAGNVSNNSSPANATTQAAADTQPPSVPTGLQASAVSSSRIDLSWNASSDNVGVTGYDIRRDGQLVTTVVGTSYSDTGLSPNTNYVYTVAARDAAGNVSNNSSPANATTQAAPDTQPPTVPTGLQASAVSSSRIDLSWNASSDNVGVTGYDIRRDGQLVTTVVGTSYSDTGLSPNTNYVYTVAARDAAGNVSNNSSPANATTQAAADTQPPSVPTGLQASAVSSSRIDLSWNASSDNVGVTGYDIRRDGQLVTTVVGTSYSDTGLSPNTNYVYTVAARDAAGNVSNNSSPANATTQAAPNDTEAPSVPTGLQGSAVSTSRIDINWNASSDNVGVTGYEIRRDGVQITTVNGTSYSDTNLAANTSYVYTVAARDAAGNVSAESVAATVNTLSFRATSSSGGGSTGPFAIVFLLILVTARVRLRLYSIFAN